MVEIETARLTLRQFTLADVDDYYRQIWSQPDVTRYLPGGQPRPKGRTVVIINSFLDHWQRHGFGLWAAIYRDAAELIGHCGLQIVQETGEVEVAYAFGKDYWGRGIASEAAGASLRFGFEELELGHVIALAVPENIGSRRVMEKNGMHYEKIVHLFGADLACYVISREGFHPLDTPYTVKG
jgi:ribosomal-protein-alanine N-acetyltransferase